MAADARTAAMEMTTSIKHISKRLVASYILDWVLIIAIVGAAGGLTYTEPNRHAFSLTDPAISYPHRENTVTTAVLLIISLIIPGAIIFVVSLLLVPGRSADRNTPTALKWRRKLWEWNTGWMGLGLALACTFFTTEALKDLGGKPRPDFLDRCDPDFSRLNEFTVSGLGAQLPGAPRFVDVRICKNQSKDVREDGFAAWPSGHTSFAWAGMLYLTLFLCAKFAITVPYLAPRIYSRNTTAAKGQDLAHHQVATTEDSEVPLRNQSAAPPIYLVILAFVPIGTALFVSLTRYSDNRHAGFDIISGAILGSIFAWFAFRWYHLPIRTGAGWSWGARTRERAFYTGLGLPSYVGTEGWVSGKIQARDLEGGPGSAGLDLQGRDGVLGAGRTDTFDRSGGGGVEHREREREHERGDTSQSASTRGLTAADEDKLEHGVERV